MSVPPQKARDLLQAADQYLLEGLKRLCEGAISQVLAPDNLEDAYGLSEAFGAPNLGKRCIHFALQHYQELVAHLGADGYAALMARMVPQLRSTLTHDLQAAAAYIAAEAVAAAAAGAAAGGEDEGMADAVLEDHPAWRMVLNNGGGGGAAGGGGAPGGGGGAGGGARAGGGGGARGRGAARTSRRRLRTRRWRRGSSRLRRRHGRQRSSNSSSSSSSSSSSNSSRQASSSRARSSPGVRWVSALPQPRAYAWGLPLVAF